MGKPNYNTELRHFELLSNNAAMNEKAEEPPKAEFKPARKLTMLGWGVGGWAILIAVIGFMMLVFIPWLDGSPVRFRDSIVFAIAIVAAIAGRAIRVFVIKRNR